VQRMSQMLLSSHNHQVQTGSCLCDLGLVCKALYCLQCFDTVGWAAGRASGLQKTEWWGTCMVICLERDADLHMAQLMPLPLNVSCFSKIQTGLPSWYRLTQVVLDKGPLNGCVCVCACVQGTLLNANFTQTFIRHGQK